MAKGSPAIFGGRPSLLDAARSSFVPSTTPPFADRHDVMVLNDAGARRPCRHTKASCADDAPHGTADAWMGRRDRSARIRARGRLGGDIGWGGVGAVKPDSISEAGLRPGPAWRRLEPWRRKARPQRRGDMPTKVAYSAHGPVPCAVRGDRRRSLFVTGAFDECCRSSPGVAHVPLHPSYR